MTFSIDSMIVAIYFCIVFIAGYFISRRGKASTDEEFLTGGHTRTWYQTALTLFAMGADPAVMSVAGLGFLWGFYLIQWPGVHMWFTTWFAAMFLVPIYWRSRITTTPEYLEMRFNVQSRAVFSLIMIAVLVVTLAGAMFLGALLLKNLLGWSMFASVLLISGVVGFYVILGGMKTVLSLDFYQAMFIIFTLLVSTIMVLVKIGGLAKFASLHALGNAGTPLVSIIPPSDWSADTSIYFPLQAILVWATIAGVGWMCLNYGMAQRLLASKNEREAQKGLLFLSFLVVFYPFCSFLIGAGMRVLSPNILPDESFMRVILDMFPVGMRGILVAGLMAALLSTVDGMLTASSTMFSKDIYLRILRPAAGGSELKRVARITEALTLLATIALFPLIIKSQSAMTFIQNFYGDVLGVVVALYIAGIFSTRTTPRAGFIALVSGVAFAVGLDVFTPINFTYVGFFSFLYTLAAAHILSRFEPAMARERLTNLTIFTLPDAKGPWVGLKSWPNLWKWALFVAGCWFSFCILWEWYVSR